MPRNLIILFLLMVSIPSLYSQERGKPFLKNYSPKEYNAQAQNWNVLQDHRGIIYVGNGDGILEYDGSNWTLTEIPGKETARSLGITKNNIVFVGTSTGFGYLSIDKSGATIYNALETQLPDSIQEKITDIWEIDVVENDVYFRANPFVFRYKDGKVDYWTPRANRFYSAFVVNGEYHVAEFNGKTSVRKIEGDSLLEVKDNDQFNGKFTSTFIPYKKDTVILGSSRRNFYKYPFSGSHKEDSLGLFNEMNTVINQYGLYTDGTAFSGGYAFGSRTAGILLFDKDFKYLGKVDQETNGLISNQAYHIAADKDGAVWVGTGNGISRIDVSSEVSFWDKDSGLDGTIYFLKRFKENLFINTSVSSFILKEGKITKLPGAPESQSWHLMEFENPEGDNKLLMSTSSIYELTDEGATQVLASPYPRVIFKMYQDSQNPYRVWLATARGLGSMLWQDGKWIVEPLIPDFDENCRSIAKDASGNIWVGTYRNGLFKLSLMGESERDYEVTAYTEADGLPAMANVLIYPITGELVIATAKGACQYNPKTNKLEPYTLLGDEFHDGSRDVYLMQEDVKGNIWLTGEFSAKSPALVAERQVSGDVKINTQPFKKIPPMGVEALLAEPDGTAWVGGSEGLFRYKPNTQFNKSDMSYATLIRKVVAGKDSVLFAGSYPEKAGKISIAALSQSSNFKPIISADDNAVDFYFAAPFFDNESQTQYKYYLDGFDDTWSDWGSKREKEYTNLSQGKYTFHVKAKNLYGNESSEATFSFEVLPPWYLTWWAYILYAILAIVIIRVVVKWNSRRLEKENERLEGIVEERTAEVRKQAEELTLKNSELSQQKEEILIQTENLRELNEEISAVNSDLSSKTEALEQANGNIQHLSAIGKAITSTLDIREVIRIVYESVNNLMDASGFGIGVYHEEENILEFKGYMEKGQPLPDHYEAIHEVATSVAGEVFNTGEMYFSNNLEEDFAKKGKSLDVLQGDVPLSLVYIPLVYGNQKVGVVTVQSFEKQAYTENHLNILQTLASYASIALANAKGYELIQVKNKSITDSIRYSKTMQNAFLPTTTEMEALGSHFVLYKPRDIVSGDFYWTLSLPEENKLYVAVADCTGHGVPGSFMSIVGVTLLNEIVSLQDVREPAQILEELNKGVVSTLSQHDDEQGNDDGMDVCLCLFETQADGSTKITYSGAKRDLYYINKFDKQLHTLKGNNKLIGGRHNKSHKSFTNKSLTLVKGTTLYLTTDGFVDQHNSERRKFGTLQMKSLLSEIATKQMSEQGKILNGIFERHRGQMEQRDDLTIIGMEL